MLRPPSVATRQDLGLAALEEAGAVGAREHADVDVERANLGRLAAIGALALFEDALAHRLLDDAVERIGEFGLGVGLAEVLGEFDAKVLVGVAALARGRGDEFVDAVLEEVAQRRRSQSELSATATYAFFTRGDSFGDLALERVDGAVRFHRHFDGLEDGVFRALLGAGFDHHDGFIGAGDDDVEVAGIGFLEGRVDDEFAVDAGDADAGRRGRRRGCSLIIRAALAPIVMSVSG